MRGGPLELELANGDRRARRSAGASASDEEAAAIVAALERFIRTTARQPAAEEPRDRWLRAAMLEGVRTEHLDDVRDPWINT
jgi:hypothetical protein